MSSSPGRIGIAIAVFDPPPQFFIEQLRSIQKQTYPDWFCVLSWDSPIAEWAQKEFGGDARFHWRHNPVRLGHKKNFEAAIRAATGANTWAVACADQDDVWDPDKLESLAELLKTNPPLSLVHSDLRVLEKDIPSVWAFEGRRPTSVQPAHLLVKNQVTGCSMMLDARLPRKYPLIPDAVEFHDHWYALAASTEGGVYPLARALLSYRQHGANVVGAVAARSALRPPGSRGAAAWLQNCKIAWRQTEALARAAWDAGMPLDRSLPSWTRLGFRRAPARSLACP